MLRKRGKRGDRVLHCRAAELRARQRRGDELPQDRVVVDGKVLPERYLPAGRHSFDFLPYRVPEGSYFVMGDNRSVSNDSRIFGPVRRRDIVGRAMIRIWPFSRLAKF